MLARHFEDHADIAALMDLLGPEAHK